MKTDFFSCLLLSSFVLLLLSGPLSSSPSTSYCAKFGKLFLLFQKALASYIRKFAYSNAKTEDLWAVLEEKSGEPIKNLMTTWTKQQGYPVVNAKLNGNYVELEQVIIRNHPSYESLHSSTCELLN